MGYYFLPPLADKQEINQNGNVRTENVTYCKLLCSDDPLPAPILINKK